MAQFKARVAQIFRDLDRYSYYELLNLSADAEQHEIRASFHRMALSMHPDRHAASADGELRGQLYAIYKRVSEGYRVLMDEERRARYDAALSEGEMRLVETERQRQGPEQPEDQVEHPQAKKFFVMGLNAERSGDLKTAQINYKFALDLVGQHEVIEKRMAWVKKMLGA